MRFDLEHGEVLLMAKPYGWTSFDVVGKVRSMARIYAGIRRLKIGHAGTLDPLATGLLILCTGRFTKRIDEFQGLEKEYTGTFTLGATTPSYDLETPVDRTFPLSDLETPDGHERISSITAKFTGDFDQIPPLYSAIWIDGKRAYKAARREEDIELKARRVNISAFEITRIELPEVGFRVACSKGTYIRALARDFGESLGSGAHLTALCRTRIGQFHLRDAYTVEELEVAFREMRNERSLPL